MYVHNMRQDGGYYNAYYTNSLALSNFNNGAYSTKSNADYAKNITRKHKLYNLQIQSKVWDIYNAK